MNRQPDDNQTTTRRQPDDTDKKDKKVKKEKNNIYTSNFELFWKAYPKRVGKDAAWRAWRKRGNELPPLQDLLDAISKQSQSRSWAEGYIPNPATWINQGRWMDEIQAVGPVHASKSPSLSWHEQDAERRKQEAIRLIQEEEPWTTPTRRS